MTSWTWQVVVAPVPRVSGVGRQALGRWAHGAGRGTSSGECVSACGRWHPGAVCSLLLLLFRTTTHAARTALSCKVSDAQGLLALREGPLRLPRSQAALRRRLDLCCGAGGQASGLQTQCARGPAVPSEVEESVAPHSTCSERKSCGINGERRRRCEREGR